MQQLRHLARLRLVPLVGLSGLVVLVEKNGPPEHCVFFCLLTVVAVVVVTVVLAGCS